MYAAVDITDVCGKGVASQCFIADGYNLTTPTKLNLINRNLGICVLG